ncbi:MAG: metallophosphoesterase family protein [Candidatus Omnitrophota bacterium]
MPSRISKLPEVIKKEAQTSDCCFHAGDFTTYSVFETLNNWVKTYGVCGNMDDNSVKEKLADKQIIKLENITIGLTHGRGHPNNLINHIKTEFACEFSQIDLFVLGTLISLLTKK